MLRSLLAAAAAFVCFCQTGVAQKKSALDKATLETYVRHLYVMDKNVTVQVGDPKPSDLPGFYNVVVSASAGNAHQDFPFLVSKDGSKIIQGTVYDVSENPYKKDLDKLKTEGAPNFGKQGAPVVIVEFCDFECPYCQREAKVLRDNLLATYPTQVHFYFKEFPLTSLHPWAKPAAIASRCIYDQKSEITPENFKDKVMDCAKQRKDLDSFKLGACIDNKTTEAEVDKDIAQGRSLGVDSTPTLFINGRRIASAAEWPMLKAVIDYEIEYQKTAKNAGEDCGCAIKLDLPIGQPSAPAPGALK